MSYKYLREFIYFFRRRRRFCFSSSSLSLLLEASFSIAEVDGAPVNETVFGAAPAVDSVDGAWYVAVEFEAAKDGGIGGAGGGEETAKNAGIGGAGGGEDMGIFDGISYRFDDVVVVVAANDGGNGGAGGILDGGVEEANGAEEMSKEKRSMNRRYRVLEIVFIETKVHARVYVINFFN